MSTDSPLEFTVGRIPGSRRIEFHGDVGYRRERPIVYYRTGEFVRRSLIAPRRIMVFSDQCPPPVTKQAAGHRSDQTRMQRSRRRYVPRQDRSRNVELVRSLFDIASPVCCDRLDSPAFLDA